MTLPEAIEHAARRLPRRAAVLGTSCRRAAPLRAACARRSPGHSATSHSAPTRCRIRCRANLAADEGETSTDGSEQPTTATQKLRGRGRPRRNEQLQDQDWQLPEGPVELTSKKGRRTAKALARERSGWDGDLNAKPSSTGTTIITPEQLVGPRLSEEELMASVAEAEDDEALELPDFLQPRDAQHAALLHNMLTMEHTLQRRWERQRIEQVAYELNNQHARKTVNRFMVVKRVAQIMAQLEHDDYKNPGPYTHVSPWALAEVEFAKEFEAFNEDLKTNLMSKAKRTADDFEDHEDDEELMLDVHLAGEPLRLYKEHELPNVEVVVEAAEPELEPDIGPRLEEFLMGVLPGVATSTQGDTFAADIFPGDSHGDYVERDIVGERDAA